MSAASGGGPDELLALTQAYCNGTLTGHEWARLERRLLADADARALFRRYLALDAALLDYGESTAEQWLNPKTKSPAGAGLKTRLPMAKAVAAAIAAVAVLAWALADRQRAEADVIASLEQVTGDVRILAADGHVRTVAADAPLRSGDTVRTRGRESSGVLAYPDGTRLTLVGDTSATCGELHSKSLAVHEGTLAASVQPQPPDKPMMLATPTAQVQVLGTRFLIEAAANRTDLSVTQGRVRLVRVSDGRAVDVSDGQRTIVTAQNTLRVEDIPRLPDTWEADFEDGLPEGWRSGEHVTQGLPKGAHGGVKASRYDSEDGHTYYGIVSQSAWSQGLFAAGKGSHLHVTLKMEDPRWMNLFISTRTSDPNELRFFANYLFKEFPKIAPGQWLTVSIPLAAFKPLDPGEGPMERVTPFQLIFSATAPDRGLVIDRMWVTPDGPGEVTAKEIE